MPAGKLLPALPATTLWPTDCKLLTKFWTGRFPRKLFQLTLNELDEIFGKATSALWVGWLEVEIEYAPTMVGRMMAAMAINAIWRIGTESMDILYHVPLPHTRQVS